MQVIKTQEFKIFIVCPKNEWLNIYQIRFKITFKSKLLNQKLLIVSGLQMNVFVQWR